VGGLVAAASILGLPIDPGALTPVALDLEDHPDNVVAALRGGFTVGVMDDHEARVLHLLPAPELRAVLLVPDGFSSTLESRQTLPPTIPRCDAVFNGGRCALLALAISQGRWDLLKVAMQDRLHQPHRAQDFAHLDEAIEAAIAAGAHGAALSGAGSSVIALSTGGEDAVAAALSRVAARHGLSAHALVLSPARRGAHIASIV
jgi:homoserine kinase